MPRSPVRTGESAPVTVHIADPHPTRQTVVELRAEPPGAVAIPASIVLEPNRRDLTFLVKGLQASGAATITATLAASSAAAQVRFVRGPPPPRLTEPLVRGSAVLSGLGMAEALIEITVNERLAGVARARQDGVFLLDVAPLRAGDQIRGRILLGGEVGPWSAPAMVRSETPAPVITTAPIEATTSIAGTGAAGARVSLLVNERIVAAGPVDASGRFAVGVAGLESGDRVSAIQTLGAETSPPSSPRIVVRKPPPPAVALQLVAGDSVVRGAGSAGALVELVADGFQVGTALVDGDGHWTLPLPGALRALQTVWAYQAVEGERSAASRFVGVIAQPPLADEAGAHVDGAAAPPPRVVAPLIAGDTAVSGIGIAGEAYEIHVNDAIAGAVVAGSEGDFERSEWAAGRQRYGTSCPAGRERVGGVGAADGAVETAAPAHCGALGRGAGRDHGRWHGRRDAGSRD